MKSRNILFNLVLFLAVLLTACVGGATPDVMMEEKERTSEESMEEPMLEDSHNNALAESTHDAKMANAMSTPEAAINDTDSMMVGPAWFSASLTDARTGQAFSINAFKGKVVLVETMAMSCSNCLKQQTQVKALHKALGVREDFVSIGLDIDPNENVDTLTGYIEDKGFDWYYAVSPADVSREIASLYGDQFLNPPSTPIVVIDRHGEAHILPFGIKSADDLMEAIKPFFDESM